MPTIQQLVEVIGRRYGIEMPLADLFYWGTEKSGVEDISTKLVNLLMNYDSTNLEDVSAEVLTLSSSDAPNMCWTTLCRPGGEPSPAEALPLRRWTRLSIMPPPIPGPRCIPRRSTVRVSGAGPHEPRPGTTLARQHARSTRLDDWRAGRAVRPPVD